MIKRTAWVITALILVGCSKNEQTQTKNIKQGYCAADAVRLLADQPPKFEFKNYDMSTATHITPTIKLHEDDYPYFSDDLNFAELDIAIERQLRRYRQRSLIGKIQLGSDVYPLSYAVKSLQKFRLFIHDYNQCKENAQQDKCLDNLNYKMRAYFNVYVPNLQEGDPRFGEEKSTLFTGYYTPVLEASSNKSKEYPHAVYARPPEKGLRSARRVDIDFKKKLYGEQLEIFYTKDLFDIYLLHVQGGGRINFTDGKKTSRHYLSYDGTNGQTWNFISKYMRQKKYIQDGSVYAQKRFLEDNPNLAYSIYETCPSYVYFKTSTQPPVGSDSVSLTDGRSIATDINYYRFKGLLSFISTNRPKDGQKFTGCEHLEFKSFQRFLLDQDTGGAIRGRARVDIYFGEDKYAEMAAYNTVQRGDLYFLMAKKN